MKVGDFAQNGRLQGLQDVSQEKVHTLPDDAAADVAWQRPYQIVERSTTWLRYSPVCSSSRLEGHKSASGPSSITMTSDYETSSPFWDVQVL